MPRCGSPPATSSRGTNWTPLSAHALLDQAEGIDRGWAAKADALRARLIPPGLDPDPLATVERLVAAQKAAEEQAADDDPDESEE